MRIEVRGRGTAVTDALRRHVEERFEVRIGKQVSELAQLDVERVEEKKPALAHDTGAEATQHQKGVTQRAPTACSNLEHSVDLVADKIARQVKRHREKRRGRREGASIKAPPEPA